MPLLCGKQPRNGQKSSSSAASERKRPLKSRNVDSVERTRAIFRGFFSTLLAIKEHRPQRAENNTAFLGVISNNGKDTWENVEVLTELFTKDGTFVDKCSSYMDGSVAPGQDRNFKVSCSSCRDVSVPLVYDKYTIAIVGAQFVRPEKVGPK